MKVYFFRGSKFTFIGVNFMEVFYNSMKVKNTFIEVIIYFDGLKKRQTVWQTPGSWRYSSFNDFRMVQKHTKKRELLCCDKLRWIKQTL